MAAVSGILCSPVYGLARPLVLVQRQPLQRGLRREHHHRPHRVVKRRALYEQEQRAGAARLSRFHRNNDGEVNELGA